MLQAYLITFAVFGAVYKTLASCMGLLLALNDSWSVSLVWWRRSFSWLLLRLFMLCIYILSVFWLLSSLTVLIYYRKVSNIRRTKIKTYMILVSTCSCLCPSHWSQVLSREWRCSWSSADRRCSNYIWVIDNFIAFKGESYIKDLTVSTLYCQIP